MVNENKYKVCKMNNFDKELISIVTPAYNEEKNLPDFHQQLIKMADEHKIDWEWLIIDDHSEDDTYQVIQRLQKSDPRIKGLRFSRNFGSHTAISCGLDHASGECVVVMAADLQDPPGAIPFVLEQWHKGFHVVWAARSRREGEKKTTIAFSRLFFFMMRYFVGIKEMPATGADFFLLDRRVVRAFSLFDEKNLSIAALITWMGFKQTIVSYDKKARLHGNTGWTLRKKINIIIDSVTSFSFLPIRLMSFVGMLVSLVGFMYAGLVSWNALTGNPPDGWASLMVVVLIIGGFQMLMMGVLGEYLWRALDESRRRPRYLVEDSTEGFGRADGC